MSGIVQQCGKLSITSLRAPVVHHRPAVDLHGLLHHVARLNQCLQNVLPLPWCEFACSPANLRQRPRLPRPLNQQRSHLVDQSAKLTSGNVPVSGQQHPACQPVVQTDGPVCILQSDCRPALPVAPTAGKQQGQFVRLFRCPRPYRRPRRVFRHPPLADVQCVLVQSLLCLLSSNTKSSKVFSSSSSGC